MHRKDQITMLAQFIIRLEEDESTSLIAHNFDRDNDDPDPNNPSESPSTSNPEIVIIDHADSVSQLHDQLEDLSQEELEERAAAAISFLPLAVMMSAQLMRALWPSLFGAEFREGP